MEHHTSRHFNLDGVLNPAAQECHPVAQVSDAERLESHDTGWGVVPFVTAGLLLSESGSGQGTDVWNYDQRS